MYRKMISILLLCVVSISLFSGCGSSQEPTTPTLPVLQSDSSTTTIADGYDVLGGSWVVGGFYYKPNNIQYLIDLSDNEALMDIYDSTYLTFYEGGTFVYMNMYNSRGKYIRQDDGSFILKTDTVFTYDFTEEGLTEKVIEKSEKNSYIVSVLDENTLLWGVLDPSTGKMKFDYDPLVFEREDTESEYIRNNKTELTQSSGANDASKQQTESKTPSADHNTTEPSSSSDKSEKPNNISSGMRNALQSAKNYLSVMPFSYSGLIEQLKFEGYSTTEATYAADNCGADWYEQAVKSAEKYLSIMAFSRSGLVEQLEFEGYTHDQAVYGVDKAY